MPCIDRMLRLTHPYSLLYLDLLLFILYFAIFHSEIPLLIIWYLVAVYFLVHMYVFLLVIIILLKKNWHRNVITIAYI